MADPQDPVTALIAMRDILVGHRRTIVATAVDIDAENLMSRQGDPHSGARWGADLKAVQEQIEAVDRALADERQTSRAEGLRARIEAAQSPEPQAD